MRFDVKKYIFIGNASIKETFFKKAQEAGIIQFIDTRETKVKEDTTEIRKRMDVLKIIRHLEPLDQIKKKDLQSAEDLIDQILQTEHEIERKHEELRLLNLEIVRISPFGSFDLKDLDYIEKEGKRNFKFYCAKKDLYHQSDLPENMIKVSSDHGLDYFLLIYPIDEEPAKLERMSEMTISRSLDDLKKDKRELKRTLEELEFKRKEFARFSRFLHEELIDKLDNIQLERSINYSQNELGGSLFAVQGWVPENKRRELDSLIENFNVFKDEVLSDPNETAPTFLENKGIQKVGEDLVKVYDTPSNTDKDPSLWVLLFFGLFFGMIVADAGYGVIYLALSLYLGFRFRQAKGLGRRMIKLATILSIFCIVCGIMLNSYFGIILSPDNPLRKYSPISLLVKREVAYHVHYNDETYKEWIKEYPSLKSSHDPHQFLAYEVKEDGRTLYPIAEDLLRNNMMELAILVGCIHILFSLFRYLDKNFNGLGWILVIIGCYIYFPVYLGAPTMTRFLFNIPQNAGKEIGLYLIAGGVILASFLAAIQHKWLALLEPMAFIQIFADILSYLRIFALGLAGVIVADTINDMVRTLPLVIALIIVFIAHSINMIIGIGGGVIHGLRLNFLEWYHYSFQGGGRLFNPLRKHIQN